MKYINVRVTQEDIASGLRGLSKECPIALALRRRFPSASVDVGGVGWYVSTLEEVISGPLSQKAMDFVLDFDSHDSVGPSVFHLKVDHLGGA